MFHNQTRSFAVKFPVNTSSFVLPSLAKHRVITPSPLRFSPTVPTVSDRFSSYWSKVNVYIISSSNIPRLNPNYILEYIGLKFKYQCLFVKISRRQPRQRLCYGFWIPQGEVKNSLTLLWGANVTSSLLACYTLSARLAINHRAEMHRQKWLS